MESSPAVAALGAGLDAARVRRAIVRRLRATGEQNLTFMTMGLGAKFVKSVSI